MEVKHGASSSVEFETSLMETVTYMKFIDDDTYSVNA